MTVFNVKMFKNYDVTTIHFLRTTSFSEVCKCQNNMQWPVVLYLGSEAIILKTYQCQKNVSLFCNCFQNGNELLKRSFQEVVFISMGLYWINVEKKM